MKSILLLGQSNMAGRGFLHEVAPIYNENILMLRNGRWQMMAEPVHFDRAVAGVGPAASFAEAWCNANPEEQLGLIPCAEGGSSLDEWSVDGALFRHAISEAKFALENSELNTIWHSAQRFFSRIREQAGYVPPEAYNDHSSYKPEDYSDVGQAEVMARYFSGELRYSPATHFIRYSDHYWQESEPGAQAVAHELTRRQMKEANRDLMNALVKMKNNGAQTILDGTSKAKAEQLMSDEQL